MDVKSSSVKKTSNFSSGGQLDIVNDIISVQRMLFKYLLGVLLYSRHVFKYSVLTVYAGQLLKVIKYLKWNFLCQLRMINRYYSLRIISSF